MTGVPGARGANSGDREQYDGERSLHACGPFGIAIGRTPAGVLCVALRNVVRVVLTDRRLCGVRKPTAIARLLGAKERLEFAVTLADIVAIDLRSVAGAKALWVQHRQGGEIRHVTFAAALCLHRQIDRLRETLAPMVAASSFAVKEE